MRDVVRRHRLLLFFVLAFLLSWYPWLIALARGTTTGPNPLGPAVAAVIVLAMTAGKAGLREFFGKWIHWRIRPSAYLISVGLPIALTGVAALVVATLGEGPVRVTSPSAPDVIEKFIFIFLFIALGEEPGWRGYALPELERRYSPLVATLLLAAVWAVWHLPLMGSEFPLRIVPAFVLGLLGTTLFQTWLFHRTEGSLLPQMILHTTVNTIGAGMVFQWFSPSDLTILWWSSAVLWLTTGVICIRAQGAGRRAQAQNAEAGTESSSSAPCPLRAAP